MVTHKTFFIPKEVANVAQTLEKAGFEAYLIGGCTRDLLLNRKPKDWDITTNAKPDEIQDLFSNTFYENDYGTVGVVNEEVSDETLKVIEVTPYRKDAVYSDYRRPDSVDFGATLGEDLARRDFTINAIALRIKDKIKDNYTVEIIDRHKGQNDLANGLIRSVGNPDIRFKEDALRMLRAARLASELGFHISPETEKAISDDASLLKNISKERVRDEFIRIIMSPRPKLGLEIAKKLSLLPYILPELLEGVGIEQNQAHSFNVFEHILRTLEHGAKKNFPLEVRLACIFHDIGKPQTRRWSNEKKDWTFYGHDIVGSHVTKTALSRLKFPVMITQKVAKLVRWHMFFSDTEKITLSAVRRMVANVGKENIWDLMDLRACDRIGTGRPKESPYRLRKYHSMVDEAIRSPISVGMLKINGSKIMEVTHETPGPRIGYILHALLEEVLDDPDRNNLEYLGERAIELSKLSEGDLMAVGERGKEKRQEEEKKEIGALRKRHWVE